MIQPTDLTELILAHIYKAFSTRREGSELCVSEVVSDMGEIAGRLVIEDIIDKLASTMVYGGFIELDYRHRGKHPSQIVDSYKSIRSLRQKAYDYISTQMEDKTSITSRYLNLSEPLLTFV